MKLDAKKKYSQNDLRRMMMEQKSKTAKKTTTTKIDSPLAKYPFKHFLTTFLSQINYSVSILNFLNFNLTVFHLHQSSTYNELGQLLCILCKSVVRSEDVWKVHINAKQHKQNIELAKQLKEKASSFAVPSKPVPTKRSATQPLDPPQAPKVPKGILKNATKPVVSSTAQSSTNEIGENGLPANFFDNAVDKPKNFFEATLKKTSIKADLVNIKRSEADNNADAIVESMETDQPAKDDVLPEGFFDDPVKDAKARNSDYKDPVEEEWEKFQQEIKEASNFSNAIIAEDQEEATTERQIDEIDEQIRNWTR